jgi:type III secretory pathway component EscV
MRMMKNPLDNAIDPRRPAWSRPEVVFVTAALVLLGAFLVPFSPTILAVTWVCTLCLAGAVTIICLAAGSSADLIGFVPLISSATLLRLVALAAASRRITQQDLPDPLTSTTGLFLAQNWPLGAMLVCLLIAAIVSIAVFAASQRIFLASSGYIQRILPLKRVGIQTDLRLGVITDEQAQTLARRIVTEFRFFAGMQGVATLIRGEIAIIVLVLLASLLMPALGSNSQTISGQEFMTQYIPPVVGLAIFTLVPAILAAAACGSMMSRDTLALRSENPSEKTSSTRKITLMSKDSGVSEEIELLNPDFPRQSHELIADFEPLGAELTAAEDSESPSANAFQQALQTAHAQSDPVDELPEMSEPKPYTVSKPVDPNWLCQSAEEYYENLSRLISNHPMPAYIILAADTPVDLPVTVAVNAAIRLAKKQKKVLLVDSDISRNALAQVFDLDPQMLQKKTLPSCFENLSVCGLPGEKLPRLLQKSSLTRVFDVILVYAPDISTVRIQHGENLAAFYFSPESESSQGLRTRVNTVRSIPPVHSAMGPQRG